MRISVTISKEEFQLLGLTYHWRLPLKRRYASWIPQQAFSLGEEDILLAERPDEIVFRQRWSLKRCTRKVRMALICHDDEDGKDVVYLKFYFI